MIVHRILSVLRGGDEAPAIRKRRTTRRSIAVETLEGRALLDAAPKALPGPAAIVESAAVRAAATSTITKTYSFSFRNTHHDTFQSNLETYEQLIPLPSGYEVVSYKVNITNSRNTAGGQFPPRVVPYTQSGYARSGSNLSAVSRSSADAFLAYARLEAGPKFDRYEGAYEGNITVQLRKLEPIKSVISNKSNSSTVAFAVFGQGTDFTLSRNSTKTYTVSRKPGVAPYVRIYQVGGGYLDYLIKDKGKYAFKTDRAGAIRLYNA